MKKFLAFAFLLVSFDSILALTSGEKAYNYLLDVAKKESDLKKKQEFVSLLGQAFFIAGKDANDEDDISGFEKIAGKGVKPVKPSEGMNKDILKKISASGKAEDVFLALFDPNEAESAEVAYGDRVADGLAKGGHKDVVKKVGEKLILISK